MRIALHTRVRTDRVDEMAELLDVVHNYTAHGAAATLPVVWTL